MIEWLMTAHDEEKPCSHRRRVGLEEEQALCIEALKSGDYDTIADAAWIELCEEAAARSRTPRQLTIE